MQTKQNAVFLTNIIKIKLINKKDKKIYHHFLVKDLCMLHALF